MAETGAELARAPSPATTIAILTGASEWPFVPSLGTRDATSDLREAFSTSAHEVEDYFVNSFRLPRRNLLSLFDTNDEVTQVLTKINNFILERKENAQALDLIYYHVGHGDFLSDSRQQFYLPIRATRSGYESTTAVMVEALASRLREQGRFLRQYLLLDCCFSAAAYTAFQSNPGGFAANQLVDQLPSRGATMLCSSSRRDRSRILDDGSKTMFTAALIAALQTGNPHGGELLTLGEIKHLAERIIQKKWPEVAVRPELHSPRVEGGDVREVPLFPNPAHDSTRFLGAGASPTLTKIIPASSKDPLDYAATLQVMLQRALARNRGGTEVVIPLVSVGGKPPSFEGSEKPPGIGREKSKPAILELSIRALYRDDIPEILARVLDLVTHTDPAGAALFARGHCENIVLASDRTVGPSADIATKAMQIIRAHRDDLNESCLFIEKNIVTATEWPGITLTVRLITAPTRSRARGGARPDTVDANIPELSAQFHIRTIFDDLVAQLNDEIRTTLGALSDPKMPSRRIQILAQSEMHLSALRQLLNGCTTYMHALRRDLVEALGGTVDQGRPSPSLGQPHQLRRELAQADVPHELADEVMKIIERRNALDPAVGEGR